MNFLQRYAMLVLLFALGIGGTAVFYGINVMFPLDLPHLSDSLQELSKNADSVLALFTGENRLLSVGMIIFFMIIFLLAIKSMFGIFLIFNFLVISTLGPVGGFFWVASHETSFTLQFLLIGTMLGLASAFYWFHPIYNPLPNWKNTADRRSYLISMEVSPQVVLSLVLMLGSLGAMALNFEFSGWPLIIFSSAGLNLVLFPIGMSAALASIDQFFVFSNQSFSSSFTSRAANWLSIFLAKHRKRVFFILNSVALTMVTGLALWGFIHQHSFKEGFFKFGYVFLVVGVSLLVLSVVFSSLKTAWGHCFPAMVSSLAFFAPLYILNHDIDDGLIALGVGIFGVSLLDSLQWFSSYKRHIQHYFDQIGASRETLLQSGRPLLWRNLVFLLFCFVPWLLNAPFTSFEWILIGSIVFTSVFQLSFMSAAVLDYRAIFFWDFAELENTPSELKSIAMFQELSTQQIRQIAMTVYRKSLEPGEILFEKNSTGNALYLVVEGGVEFFEEAELNKPERIIETYRQGRSFGEMELLHLAIWPYSARAMDKTSLLMINDHVLQQLLMHHPQIAAKVLFTEASSFHQKQSRTSQHILEKIVSASWRPGGTMTSYGIELKPEEVIDEYLRSLDMDEEELCENIEEIIKDGVVTYEERRDLETKAYLDGFLSPIERFQIERLQRLINNGEVKEDKEGFDGVLHRMTNAQIQWLRSNFTHLTFSGGDIPWEPGDLADFFLILLNGKASVAKSIAGRNVPLWTIFSGELVGEEILVSNEKHRSYRLTFLEESEVLILTRRQLNELIHHKQEIAAIMAYNLLYLLANRCRKDSRFLASFDGHVVLNDHNKEIGLLPLPKPEDLKVEEVPEEESSVENGNSLPV